MTSALHFVVLSIAVLLNAGVLAQQPEFNDENYAAWREHILPSESELAFLSIPWQRTFKDGIIKADQADKPVLLWAMNGHPLGCT